MSKKPIDRSKLKAATQVATAARAYNEHGMVNPAVYHASTVTFEDVEALKNRKQPYVYGRRGTPTSRAIEEAIAELEGGFACKVSPSGLAAITTALLAFLKSGDHLLMVDTVYAPVRDVCDRLLAGLGIETTYYDPLVGEKLKGLIKPNTKIVYLECPGSQTMEMQDVPLLCKIIHEHGALAMIDNTWSAGHFFKAFDHGCDISVQAATKYIVGHSDAMFGSVVCSEATWPQFCEMYEIMGQFAGPDDMYLALRGLRTLDVRLERHQKSAIQVAEWLRGRAEVETVLYPALSNAPGHAIWKRDFTGASGLFSLILKPASDKAVAAMLDGLELFSMGYSWGGFESLVVPFKPHRTVTQWTTDGPALRLHIGLEHPEDLIADLDAGFKRLNNASPAKGQAEFASPDAPFRRTT
ncbi:cystathionine beta-lyase [Aestuariivirga litoralis]|uniref:cystathionine beta-lyase n=1 Tax=Aestuariivirga litoralis TaxID=2650924 RepID=UPI0018C7F805|nr:cystathionine beta-lyase [Aestuariivirga litoralis]MBG1231482.1 cystathionine beta-lyase [Aestuariivirga litoralis]